MSETRVNGLTKHWKLSCSGHCLTGQSILPRFSRCHLFIRILRALIAQAIAEDLTLPTTDGAIATYAASGLRVIR